MATSWPSAWVMRSPVFTPARSAGLSGATERTRRPSRSASPTDARSWRATSAGARPTPSTRRCTDSPRTSASTAARSSCVGGDRQVEAVGQAGGVDPQQPAARRRPTGCPEEPRASGRGVLQAAGDAAAPRTAEAALDAAHHAVGDARAAVGGAPHREHDLAGLGRLVGPRQRGRVAGVDLEDDEVAVGVHAGDATLLGASVGEGHLGGAVAQVVGVGEHAARRRRRCRSRDPGRGRCGRPTGWAAARAVRAASAMRGGVGAGHGRSSANL